MELKILCVHGVGNHPNGGLWEGRWRDSIVDSLRELDGKVEASIKFVYLDEVFAKYPIDAVDVIEALAKLAKSGIASILREPKAIGDQIRWTAGMVVQWVENENLRADTRRILQAAIEEFDPHIVCGHSLGSLVCYDTFTDGGAQLIENRRFVSCGSQIGNPFVVGNFAAGRLSPLENAKFWYHLYNREDDVFTAEIRLSAPNFAQVNTTFDLPGIGDHDVTCYMSHRRTLDTVWSDALMAQSENAIERALHEEVSDQISEPARRWAVKPNKRALLVGISEYPDPSNRLEGCVNDVFLMSSLLQESGFEAEDIRIVLNDRATHRGVRDRLEWLLDGAKDGDTRFFYYSGHGTQFPAYGVGDRVDRLDEALVLHDFDWSRERAFTDDDFYALYSQLPYGLQFLAFFDCCHSGGMTRGAVRKVRGIDPPDDIRHRMLRWDAKREMWVEREIESPNPEFESRMNATTSAKRPRRFTHRLGQAMDLRTLPRSVQADEEGRRKHKGPYLPTLIQASREEEYSFEYQHGPVSYGAFTFCLAKALRRDRRLKGSHLTFEGLIGAVGKELEELGYEQHPALVAPSEARKRQIPLSAG